MQSKIFPSKNDILSIAESLACNEIISLAHSRKIKKISYNEYEQLRIAFTQYWFDCHPEIQKTFWSAWGRSQNLKVLLDEFLKNSGIFVIPKKIPAALHDFTLEGSRLSRLKSLERKLIIKKALKKMFFKTP